MEVPVVSAEAAFVDARELAQAVVTLLDRDDTRPEIQDCPMDAAGSRSRGAEGRVRPLRIVDDDAAAANATFFVSVREVPHPEGVGLEPVYERVTYVTTHDGDARAPVGLPGKDVLTREVELKRTHEQHQIVLRDRAVVDHVRRVDVDRLWRSSDHAIGANHCPAEVGRIETVAEYDHIAGHRIDLRMRAHPLGQRTGEAPRSHRAQPVGKREGKIAFGERQEASSVAHDVDVGHVAEWLPRELRPDLVDAWCNRRQHTAPQGTPGSLLGSQARRAHVPVPVAGPSSEERDGVDHSVPVEGIRVRANGREPRVGSVADVGSYKIVRDRSLHHLTGRVGQLILDRGEDPVEMRVGGNVDELWHGSQF